MSRLPRSVYAYLNASLRAGEARKRAAKVLVSASGPSAALADEANARAVCILH